MIAVLYQANYSKNYLIFVSPLYFGIGKLLDSYSSNVLTFGSSPASCLGKLSCIRKDKGRIDTSDMWIVVSVYIYNYLWLVCQLFIHKNW